MVICHSLIHFGYIYRKEEDEEINSLFKTSPWENLSN